MDPTQKGEYEELLSGEPYTKARAMNKAVFEEGLEKGMKRGLEQGIERGTQNTLLRLGRKRFGPPSEALEARVRSINDLARLEALTERILEVPSWEELLND